jgi:Zn ribbon nucleic-acid-binding protein/very-short-patch-repair endonuclease
MGHVRRKQMLKKSNTDEFKKKVSEISNKYTVLGEYSNAHTKILMKHEECGKEYLVSPNKFIQGRRCPQCNPVPEKKSTDFFRKEVLSLAGKEYTVVSSYLGTGKPITIRHAVCGKEYETTPNKFLMGRRCPKCFGTPNLGSKGFSKKIKELYKGEFSLAGEYTDNKTEVKIKHEKCGSIFSKTPTNFYRSPSCPKCKRRSIGEEKVKEWLNSKGIVFKTDYRFSDCRNKRRLPFDFALMDEAGKVYTLIEFDGRQHFDENSIFQGSKENDRIKNEYCQKKGLKLIRIPHWKINSVEKILSKELL